MAYVARSQEPSRRRLLSVDSLSLLELVVLVPVTGVLVLWLIPKWFDIQWSCVTGLGVQGNTPGDSYADTFAVLGTFGWILVAIVVLFAHIAERPRLGAVVAAAWFGLLVGGALLWAAAIGPAPCPR
jgi:hypothetical protein